MTKAFSRTVPTQLLSIMHVVHFIFCSSCPRHSAYCIYASRIRSFKLWIRAILSPILIFIAHTSLLLLKQVFLTTTVVRHSYSTSHTSWTPSPFTSSSKLTLLQTWLFRYQIAFSCLYHCYAPSIGHCSLFWLPSSMWTKLLAGRAPTVVRPNIYGSRAFPCRLSEEYSLCADPPFDTYNESLWCKTRMCGSSYVLAESCPADESEKADSLCAQSEQPREIIKCKSGHKPMDHYLPFECSHDNCTEQAFVCQCELVNIASVTLRKVAEYKSKYCYRG